MHGINSSRMLGYQKQRILCWQRLFSDQMVGWFFCQPALRHIVNFVKMEKHSKLKKKKTGTYNHIFHCLVGV